MDILSCPARKNISDALELIEHDANGCDECLCESSPRESEDVVHAVQTEKPAPERNDHKSHTGPVKRKLSDGGANAAKSIKRDKDLFAMPVNRAIHTLKTQEGVSRGEAAVELLYKRRTVAKKVEAAEQNERVDPTQMPYLPKYVPLPKNEDGSLPTSCLPIHDHKRYVAIITNNLKPESVIRFMQNNLELQGFDERLFHERQYFLQIAVEWLNSMPQNPFRYEINGARSLFKERQNERLKVLGDLKFAQAMKSVEWTSIPTSQMAKVLRPKVTQELCMGKTPSVQVPDPRRKCGVILNSQTVRAKTLKEHELLENDSLALEFVAKKELEIVMDGCSLRSLLTEPWTYRNQKYGLKVQVFKRTIEGRFCKFIVFSKPFLMDQINPMTVQRDFLKWALRATIMKEEKKKVDCTSKKVSNERQEMVVEKSHDGDVTELRIDDSGDSHQNNQLGAVSNEPALPQANAGPAVSFGIDLLDGIFSSMGDIPDTSSGHMDEPSFSTASRRYKYSVLKLGEDTKHRILVRTSNHGTDLDGDLASFSVKAEYVPSVGAEVITREEDLSAYLTTTLKHSNKHLIFRIHPQSGSVLQIERRKASTMYSQFSEETKQILSHRCARLCILLDELKEMEEGVYLLEKRADKLNILREGDGENAVDRKAIGDVVFLRSPWEIQKKRKNKWRKGKPEESEANIKLDEIKEVVSEVARETETGENSEGPCEENAKGSQVTEAKENNEQNGEHGQIVEEQDRPDDGRHYVHIPKPSQIFNGINVRIPLVWQIVTSRIPGSLPPKRDQPTGDRRKHNKKPHYKHNKGQQQRFNKYNSAGEDIFGQDVL